MACHSFVGSWLNRGYTGHEHHRTFGIINMNGRLYDPLLGRMLSPDNYAHDGSQGANRYSYVLNNPLKYTDPDGENPAIINSNGSAVYFSMDGYVDRSAEPYYIAGGMVVATVAYFSIKAGIAAAASASSAAAATAATAGSAAAGGGAAIASAIPFVAAAVAVALYINDCAHNVQQANDANNVAVQNVQVGQSGSSSYATAAPYTPMQLNLMAFEPRMPSGSLCSVGAYGDLFSTTPETNPYENKEWYKFLKENMQLFKNTSEDVIGEGKEQGYLDINGKVSDCVQGTPTGVSTMGTLGKGFFNSDVYLEIHFHPFLNGSSDNPYSPGDLGGLMRLINEIAKNAKEAERPDHINITRPNPGDWIDITYSPDYIYVMEVTNITKSSTINDIDGLLKKIGEEIDNPKDMRPRHERTMDAYKKYLSNTPIHLYVAPSGTLNFTKIF